MSQHDNLGQDPYGYADLDIYTFDVNFDRKFGFNVDAPVKADSETSPAAHPHLVGMDDGELFVVATPDAIFGPYATKAAAQSLLDDGTVNADESLVMQLIYP